jgi:hypothetical protein
VTAALAMDASSAEVWILFPDAVQRVALAKRCAADPGSLQIVRPQPRRSSKRPKP